MRDRIAADLALFGATARPLESAPPEGAALAGRAALIIGATVEPGLAVAGALAAAGADLALHASPGSSAPADLCDRLAARHGVRVALAADGAVGPGAIEELVLRATRRLDRIDILIVNAAAAPAAAGPALRAALPAMNARGWGRIVVLAPPAVADAHALPALTRGAALAGAVRGVTANLIRLNDGQIASADAVGALAVLLCGEGAAMLTGAVLPIEGFAGTS